MIPKQTNKEAILSVRLSIKNNYVKPRFRNPGGHANTEAMFLLSLGSVKKLVILKIKFEGFSPRMSKLRI